MSTGRNSAGPYNQLNGKKALVHLILMKHHWMPKQINEMKFDELLLSIQDELTLDKISVAQKFLDYRDWRSQIHHFDEILTKMNGILICLHNI